MPGRAPEGTLKNAVRRRIAARPELRVRPFDTSRIESELRIAADILNAEYGADPIYSASTQVARFALESLFPCGDWGLCLIAEIDGEPAGVMINAPDCDAGWRLPCGARRRNSTRRRITRHSWRTDRELRRRTGHRPEVPAYARRTRAFLRLLGRRRQRDYTYNRACFVDEDNRGCLSVIAAFDGRVARRYRVYQTELAAAGAGLRKRGTGQVDRAVAVVVAHPCRQPQTFEQSDERRRIEFFDVDHVAHIPAAVDVNSAAATAVNAGGVGDRLAADLGKTLRSDRRRCRAAVHAPGRPRRL